MKAKYIILLNINLVPLYNTKGRVWGGGKKSGERSDTIEVRCILIGINKALINIAWLEGVCLYQQNDVEMTIMVYSWPCN